MTAWTATSEKRYLHRILNRLGGRTPFGQRSPIYECVTPAYLQAPLMQPPTCHITAYSMMG
ncbi:hypothetical protein EHG02_22530 [Salmonella enterica]|nr:hypothetical protein [Salmonella enterica]